MRMNTYLMLNVIHDNQVTKKEDEMVYTGKKCFCSPYTIIMSQIIEKHELQIFVINNFSHKLDVFELLI